VTVGVLEEECRRLNRRFVTFQAEKRPYVTLKWAQTRDGYLDNNRPAGSPAAWMTGPAARTLVHRLRAQSAAILAGTDTIERDDPSLTVRESGGKNPLRVVLDRTHRLSPKANVFDNEAETLVITDLGRGEEEKLLERLHGKDIQSLFIEGGGKLLRSFIDKGLWDEAYVFVSPLRVRDLPNGTSDEPIGVKAPEMPGEIVSAEKIGDSELFYCEAKR
jgi:diaminohydroxyphosphoribosylaminopyrimidine deaminase/5-amino-6-(5-phosphoribosylamino)uracil reductase